MRTVSSPKLTVETKYSDQECFDRMCELGVAGKFEGRTLEFARSLAKDFKKKGKWSAGQAPWAHKLVIDAEAVKPSENIIIQGFGSIVEHMQNCYARREEVGGKGLLHPKVGVSSNNVSITMRYKSSGRNAGRVSIADGETFYGWINADGGYVRYRSATDDVVALLKRIATNPSVVINQLGRESGKCCYCLLDLTTVQSKIAGCGKKCSENWGVDYPDAAQTRSWLENNGYQILDGSTDAERWRVKHGS